MENETKSNEQINVLIYKSLFVYIKDQCKYILAQKIHLMET